MGLWEGGDNGIPRPVFLRRDASMVMDPRQGALGRSQFWVWSEIIPFSSGPRFVRTLHYIPSVLGGPTWHGSWILELDKAVVHVNMVLVNFMWLQLSKY